MPRRLIAIALLLGGCGRFAFDPTGDAAPAPEFRFRQRIDVYSTRLSVDVLDPFPLFVGVGAADPAQAPTPDQLRFFAEDGVTPLPFELEAPQHGAQKFDAWVRLPSLTTGKDMVVYAMWGDPALVGASSPHDVFDGPFVGVWHMADGTDSSVNAADGTYTGTAIVDGIAGLARDLGGGYLSAPSTGLLGLGATGATWSAWVRMASYPGSGLVTTAVGLETSGTPGGNDFRLGPSEGGSVGGEVTLNPDLQTTYLNGGIAPIDAWTQIAMVYDQSTLRMIVNGVDQGTSTTAGTTLSISTDRRILFGIDCNGCGTGPPNEDQLDGAIDEIRIQSVARSAAWFAAEFKMLDGGLVSVGTVEAL